jgi:hypothetical protein
MSRIKFTSLLAVSAVTLSAAIFANAQNYQDNLNLTGEYISSQQLSDGAILYSSTEIEPYFANLAAIGWLKDSRTNRIPQAENWISWYLAHLNWPDNQGIYGTVYNYTVSNGVETSTNSYDSADAYSATFLTLAEALWNTGDPGAQTFITETVGEYDLNVSGNVITNLQQSNGLIEAMPSDPIEYLMDNSEDYRGLSDFANLAKQAWGDSSTESWYNAHASGIQSGIQNTLYISSTKLYHPFAGSPPPNLKAFYPDAVSQLWPAVNGVVSGSQANSSYAKFKAAWPGWTTLSFATPSDPFPWCAVSYAAYLAGDKANVNKYILAIQNNYVDANPAFEWPFSSSEGGWFMRTNAAMGYVK